MAHRALCLLPLVSAFGPARRLPVPRRQGLQARTDAQLKQGIGEFYDESSGIWEDVWGEHMHHGYYREKEKAATFERHVEAQDDMIEKALELCGADAVQARCRKAGTRMRVVDIGCGIGGSSRYIARKYDADVIGLTLSPKQAARGNELSQGLNVTLQCGDATATSFADGSFDLVWSLESGEHMPDKSKFVEEMTRLCAPQGAVSCVTWCHRDLEKGAALGRVERAVLGLINYCYYLPQWCSGADYRFLFSKQPGFSSKAMVVEDWTRNIAPFWPAVFRSALRLKSLRGLARTGVRTARGAVAILLMIVGYRLGTVKFVAVAANKGVAV
jgi:tocopherol O-methyltransferase